MHRIWLLLVNLAMLGCLVLAVPLEGQAQANKPKGGVIPVVATFRDSAVPPDRIKSDGKGILTLPLFALNTAGLACTQGSR